MTQPATLTEVVLGEIRAEMGRQKMTGRAVAEAMGVTHVYVSRRLSGTVPLTLADLDRIAVALSVPVTDLFPRQMASAA
ncbi:Helix-turn-helix [Micromonospora pallida]|uniref:Helix-turn-helix n=1 Tax=Micromonospora pallida TaxID=145854 RepID=A0A1C6TN86_9ACTN|nr:helix-turn-helix transcriptional regulator [Micromonospora pallida]SCL43219.1 Helix-turn-helix [Micromonospora pallida]